VTNLIFTFVGLWLIDRLGRRTLLTIGSFGYIASLGLTAWAFFTQHFSIVPACIFAFIAAHAIGQGAVIWVFISEILPHATSRERPGARQLHALDFRRAAHHIFPENGFGISCRLGLPFLLRDDGAAAPLGAHDGA
jgi:MFS family permease